MHMTNCYKWQFNQIVSAFIKKYNEKNMFCVTTICHVEQIDEDKFAFVRRLENSMSSQPLYERIVIDRSEKTLKGYTFENPKTDVYSENYVYAADGANTSYDMYLLRSPGL